MHCPEINTKNDICLFERERESSDIRFFIREHHMLACQAEMKTDIIDRFENKPHYAPPPPHTQCGLFIILYVSLLLRRMLYHLLRELIIDNDRAHLCVPDKLQ